MRCCVSAASSAPPPPAGPKRSTAGRCAFRYPPGRLLPRPFGRGEGRGEGAGLGNIEHPTFNIEHPTPTCLITGATSGIGGATARELARAGWRLLLTGRNRAAGESLATELRGLGPDTLAEFFAADISQPASVRQLVGWVEQKAPALEALVNNAGARFNRYEQTEAGVERTFAVNHLGHFLLTGLLKDRLVAAGGARVIALGSGAHFQADPSLGWSMAREQYNGKVAYANSKLACILFARELARRWTGLPVFAVAVDPGAAATRFASNNGLLAGFKHRIYHRLKGNLISVTQAAQGVVQVVTTPVRELQPGGYYHAGQPTHSSPAASDPALARELWEVSESPREPS